MWEILAFLIRKVSNIAYVGCSFYSEELEERFWGWELPLCKGLMVVMLLWDWEKNIAESFQFFIVIMWELCWASWRKGSREWFLWKRGELRHEGISCCNSPRGDRVDGDGVRRESLAYKIGCTRFKIVNHFPPSGRGPADVGLAEPRYQFLVSFIFRCFISILTFHLNFYSLICGCSCLT